MSNNVSQTETDQLIALRKRIDLFSEVRNWGKYHTPKNLSMAMSVEVSELMEIFQWQDGAEGFSAFSDQKKEAVAHEVADVFIYLMRFCSVTGIDPLKAAEEKLKLNDLKYPADVVKGRSDKYSDY
ncbi:nucleotide pyrophosphohydrolase [Bordetella sp. 02P26C-1]|uniref:nucleotide pyrophosphohydrolase n=1 Tax=Bordetella sp. 02P26C-1 TaxID=2683195 RepID=UPI001352C96B|nr:nucleotide pyrophosphohydrolase [Bordetella sp. 02P26C-1]MVW78089.1 nucleotide pyrophosphohydrolase [Bordetella sp. 02P26C-1]